MKRVVYFVWLWLVPLAVKAQYDAQFTHFGVVKSYYNPAAIGLSSQIETIAAFKQQWLGIGGAPQSVLVTANSTLNFLDRTHGVGLAMFNESIGLFKHNILSAKYAYKKKLWGGELQVGLQAEMISESFSGSEVHIPESGDHSQNDEAIPTSNVSGSGFDAGLGVFYHTKQWFVGLSALHLLQPKIELSENSYFNPVRAYYLLSTYNIELNNPLLTVQPAVLLKSTVQMNTVDVQMRLVYDQKLSAGLGWRSNESLSVLLGAKFGKIQAGYAYDYPITFLSKGTSGSHELFLTYTMDITRGKANKNSYKSVRIL